MSLSKCKYCNSEVEWFTDEVTGKNLPHNLDKTRHKCQQYFDANPKIQKPVFQPRQDTLSALQTQVKQQSGNSSREFWEERDRKYLERQKERDVLFEQKHSELMSELQHMNFLLGDIRNILAERKG